MNSTPDPDSDGAVFEFLEGFRLALAAGATLPVVPDELTRRLSPLELQRLNRLLALELERQAAQRSTLYAPPFQPSLTEQAPSAVNGYEKLGVLGEGGMGIVYKVREPRLGRVIALKMALGISPQGELSRARTRRRFLEEIRLTARLSHPGIPPLHAASAPDEGRLWYTMRLVDGQTLEAHLRRPPAGGHDRRMQHITWLVQVCQAVGYAHSQDIIHRDLKPLNIMIGAHGEVQVIDWGLARSVAGQPAPAAGHTESPTDDDPRLATGLAGTPKYMAPEQARGDQPLTPAIDVFSLGAILCDILTGRPPYPTAPDPRSLLLAVAAGDVAEAFERLDRCGADPAYVLIAKECLALEPALRPPAQKVAERLTAVAANAAADAQRARVDQARAESELARQRQASEHARHRYRLRVRAVAAVTLAVGVCGAIAFWQRDAARTAAQKAESASKTATQASEVATTRLRENTRLLDLRRVADADRAFAEGEAVQAVVDLRVVDPANRGLAWRLLSRKVFGAGLTLSGFASKALAIGASADGRRVVVVTGDGSIIVWNFLTGAELARIRTAPLVPSAAAVFEDGRRVVLAGPDGVLSVWDVFLGRAITTIGSAGVPVGNIALAGNGSRVATVAEGTVRVWEVSTGKLLAVIESEKLTHDTFYYVALSWDGRMVATRSSKNLIVWNAVTGSKVSTLPDAGSYASGVFDLSLTRDGTRAVTAEWFGGAASVWELGTGRNEIRITGRYDTGVRRVAVSADGRRVASWHVHHGLYVADARTGRLVKSLPEIDGPTAALAFTPDNAFLLAANTRGRVAVIDIREDLTLDGFEAALHNTSPGAFTPRMALSVNGQKVLAVGTDGVGRVWDTHTRQLTAVLRSTEGDVADFALSGDGNKAVFVTKNGAVVTRDARSGATIRRSAVGDAKARPSVLSRDGTRLVSVNDDGVKVWDTERGMTLVSINDERSRGAGSVAVSADGTALAFSGTQTDVFDTRSGMRRATLQQGGLGVALSRSGRYLCLDGRGPKLIDIAAGQSVAALPSYTSSNWGGVGSDKVFAFSDTEDELAALYPDGTLRLFDLPSGHEVIRWPLSRTPLRTAGAALAVHRHGVTLVLPDGGVRRFDATVSDADLAAGLLPAGRSTLLLSGQAVAGGSTRPDARWHAGRRNELAGRGEWAAAALHASYEQRALAALAFEAGRLDRAVLRLLGAELFNALARPGIGPSGR